MKFGLDDLTDPRLSHLAAASHAFYAQREAGRGPNSPEELQTARANTAPPTPSTPRAAVEPLDAGGRRVPARLHTPTNPAAAGVLLDIHSGGFYLGSAAANDIRNRDLADALGIAVVSVDYRLAPENPWPAAPDDCETAALWLTDHAPHRFGTTKLAIGGSSAGATLAMSTLLLLRDQAITAFDCAVLQFGTYDLSAQTPAGRLIADEYFLHAYTGSAEDRTHPDISPIYADLTGLSAGPGHRRRRRHPPPGQPRPGRTPVRGRRRRRPARLLRLPTDSPATPPPWQQPR